MEENRKQQLAISSSKPPASGEVAPSFAAYDVSRLEIRQGGGIEELQGGYSEALVNQGVYDSVKSQLASGKGTKIQTSSSAQAASQTQGTNKNGAA